MTLLMILAYLVLAFWLISGLFVALVLFWFFRFMLRTYRDIQRMNEFAKPRKRGIYS